MRKTIKKTGIIVAILAILVNAVLPLCNAFAATAEDDYAYVPPADNIGSVKDIMGNEARANLAIYILANCFAHGINLHESWDDIYKPSVIFDVLGTDRRVDVGYWMEKKLTGEASDGRVWCSEKVGEGHSIFTETAQALGITKEELFCEVEDGRYVGPGIFKAKDGKECGDTGSKTEYTRNGNGSGDGRSQLDADNIRDYAWGRHIEKLYNAAKEKNGWYTSFDIIQSYSFPNVNGYYIYTNELKTHCGSTTDYDTKSESNMDLNNVTQDKTQAAKVVYTHHSANEEFDHTFVSRFNDNDSKCSDMIARANEDDLYGSFRRRMMATLNTLCKKSIDDRMAGYSGTIPAETQAAYNAAVANTSRFPSGQFIEAVDGGEITDETTGWKCSDIGDIEGAGQEDPELDDDEEAAPDCYNKAGSLGWIVCPLITTGAEMVQTTYEGMVVPFLRMNPKLFAKDNGTYIAWNIFRNFANIAFVIVFLVVIFSQLTGYGIDNYGIKKILPKLIVSAILINMSYIICQLAVDIANIVGSGVGSVFTTIGDMVMKDAPSVCEGACNAATAGSGGGAGTWIALIAVIVAITAVAVLAIGPQILIPVLLGIISFVIAIFFLFVILGIRQALAVLLVAASPLAFVCYMLPNTKKIFDKWFSSLKGLLIAYPVCSAMVYGGDMVAKIILSAYGTEAKDLASLTPILSAGVIAIAPIFLIPGVIKKSMAGIGSLSARLQGGLTHRARGSADRRLQNSPLTHRQRYREKARMDRANARMGEYNRKRAERRINGANIPIVTKRTGATFGGLGKKDYGKMSAAQRREFNMANGAISAYDNEMLAGYKQQAAGMGADDVAKMFDASVRGDSIDMNMAETAINRMGELDQGQMLESLSKFTSSAAFKKMDQAQRNRLISTLNAQSGNTVAKAYAKELGKGSTASLDDAISSGAIARNIANMDKNVVANTDKDVLRYMSGENSDGSVNTTSSALANAFTNEQMSTAMSSGAISGKSEKEFNKVIESRDAGLVKSDLEKLTTEQFTTTMDSSLDSAAKAMRNGGMDGAKEVYKVANGHMRNLTKPGNEQLLQRISKEKNKYRNPTPPTP